jgi:hypothetical protein
MGDGEPFQTCAAGHSIDVKLEIRDDLNCEQIEIYDGSRRLAVAEGSPPTAILPGFEPGIYALIAEALLTDGTRVPAVQRSKKRRISSSPGE